MQIEIGRRYRTRGGDTGTVIDLGDGYECPFRFQLDKSLRTYTVSRSGMLSCAKTSADDLVEEIETPVTAPVTALPSEAAAGIKADRAAVYGEANDAFRRIALAWTAVLDHDITPVDVARCMAALKLVRDALNPEHKDSLIDLINYADIAETLKNG